MVNASIQKANVIFTFDDGEVETVTVNKQARLDENTMPASDSDGTFVLDFQGVGKTIRLAGYLYDTTDNGSRTSSGDSVITIEQQIDWLLALVNGSQTGYTLNTTYQTNKRVYCRSIDVTEKAGDPLRVAFSMDFVEGS